ncbi:hypothetical protein EHQ12_03565 [Leptospira gomenensis]|uniref:Uncharacterized protein n=1 Tax=Leptospira gomenensis TaxID=2484974 RepID=A0A5F1Y8X8_9LEPT|nr:hypothetical protein EHQ17_12820 [Leptospira gomenensis]TGK41778.1 hypothetical protein EHQ07_15645 [Leptospira gomenensis]TGK43397.1 hypothetical protein EHQ12_03565 [Leptospira gomenensis]TGK61496.1 hypothetical protein EHQ13_08215 [Leptospira gomenensis]
MTVFATIATLASSCSNYGGDSDQKSKDADKKNCQVAAASYIACTSSNPAYSSSCDPLYLGVLSFCGGGGTSGSAGSGGGY